jgi:preprotein translocase subunit YajC
MGEAVGEAGGGMSQLVIFALIFVGMWFLLIAPNRKRQKLHQKMLAALRVGDRVVLSSGFFGKIVRMAEGRLLVELARGVRVEVLRSHVQQLAESGGESMDEIGDGGEDNGEDGEKEKPTRGTGRSRRVVAKKSPAKK